MLGSSRRRAQRPARRGRGRTALVDELLADADLVCANLEAPFSGQGPARGLRAEPSTVAALRPLNVVNVATNSHPRLRRTPDPPPAGHAQRCRHPPDRRRPRRRRRRSRWLCRRPARGAWASSAAPRVRSCPVAGSPVTCSRCAREPAAAAHRRERFAELDARWSSAECSTRATSTSRSLPSLRERLHALRRAGADVAADAPSARGWPATNA